MSLRGIWAAVLTPVDARLNPDPSKAIEYYADLLRDGCDGLNVLGTTGEAPSFGLPQRARFMEAIAGSELPRERIMAGTGSTSLEDTAALTKTAMACGFAAALVLPPFYFRDVSDDGVLRYFDALLARVEVRPGALALYNFPAISGVAFRASLVAALIARFPGVFGALKDSSNDSALQRELIVAHPELAVFPSSEETLLEGCAFGAAGCISGSVALWPALAKRVLQTRDPSEARRLAALRRSIAGPQLLLRVRYLTANLRSDETWLRAMPPLATLDPAEAPALDELIRSF